MNDIRYGMILLEGIGVCHLLIGRDERGLRGELQYTAGCLVEDECICSA